AVVILDRAVELALVAPRFAAVVVGVGVIGIEADGLVVVADRAIRLAAPAEQVAAVVVGLGIGAVSLDRLVVGGQPAVLVARMAVGEATIEIGVGEIAALRLSALDDRATAGDRHVGRRLRRAARPVRVTWRGVTGGDEPDDGDDTKRAESHRASLL